LTKKFEKKIDQPNIPEPKSSENKVTKKKFIPVNWIVFLFSITIVLISLISVIFPALIASNNSTINELQELGIVFADVNPFELGVWAIPVIISNIVIFGILFFYKSSN